jgi:hypothetical protein
MVRCKANSDGDLFGNRSPFLAHQESVLRLLRSFREQAYL